MANSPELCEDQLQFFATFGYIVLQQLLTPEDLEILAAEIDQGLDVQFPHKPFDGSQRQWSRMTDETTPFSASLMEDVRFLTPAQQICGEDVLGIGIDANHYVGDTGWHSDTGNPQQIAVKYIFYLDPVTAKTGALRVIPGSHLLQETERRIFAKGIQNTPLQEVPCQTINTNPGDVIAFDVRTWHASYGGSQNRRACNLDYFQNPKASDDIELLLQLGRSHAGSINHFDTKRKFNYSKNWLKNPHQSQIRQRWIDRFHEIGYLDQPGVAEL
ncbi:TPA: hypothetical protein EYO57_03495 [Candidatus Poribacteria bacterium]|nr:hypothetical protein [Candidatus Poribacteria bacterium]